MSVPQYTTPTFTLTFSDQALDLTQASNVYVTFQSGNHILTKNGNDLTVQAKQIDVYLNQEETSHFNLGGVKIQANWTTYYGDRAASDVVTYQISEQLLKRVVE